MAAIRLTCPPTAVMRVAVRARLNTATAVPLAEEDDGARGAKTVRILDAAAKALNRHGISQTSLAQIAGQIGVTRAALYYYFKDQVELVFQCYLRCCSLMDAAIDTALESDGDCWAKIEAFIDLILGDEALELVALNEIAYLLPHQQSAVLRAISAVRDRLAALIREGAETGQFRSSAPRIVAASILGVVLWIPMAQRWPTYGVRSRGAIVEAVKSTLRWGAAVDREAPCGYAPFTLSPMMLPAVQVFDADVMAAARQEAILATASWLFNLKGVDATSLDEIALQLGVTKKVIYHNVGDKETLLAECYRRAFRFYEEILRQMQQYPGSRIDATCASIDALATASLMRDLAPLEPVGGFEVLPKKIKSEILSSSARMFEMHLSSNRQGQIEGSVRDVDLATYISIRPGAYQWLPKWHDTFDAEELAAAPREIAELVRVGLMPLGAKA